MKHFIWRSAVRVTMICTTFFYYTNSNAQDNQFNSSGNLKTTKQYYDDKAASDAKAKQNNVSTTGGSSINSGGTSAAFRKEVREIKANKKKSHADSKKKIKGYDYVGPFIYLPGGPGGFKIVSKGGKFGLISWIDDLARDQLPLVYDEVKLTGNPEPTFSVRVDKKWGIMSWAKFALVPIEYDEEIKLYSNEMAVIKDGEKFTIDKNAHRIIPK
ncbi:MAG: hypothetical protein ABIN01_16815 [Ferruginibacter sp.]